MAKQRNIEENVTPIEGAENFQSTEPDTTVETLQQEQTATTPPVATEKREKKPLTEESDSYTLDVLKAFPVHESLYIDKQGGAFTSDTPKSIRGIAVLYKNPFYKQQ